MKKFSKILAFLLSLSILLSLNAFAADHVDFVLIEEKSSDVSPVYDVTVHSGAVIAEGEYAEKKEYEDDYYEIYSVTFDASGTEPIIVNKHGFSGYWGHICSLSFNGNGDIYLGESAFSGLCVQKLTLPANIKFLENAKGVFNTCLNLKKVDIYCDLVPSMFDDSNYLEEVNFKGNITEIPDNAFSACALKNIDIPDTVKRIGKKAFSGNLTFVNRFNLPEGLETIGAYAFYGTDILSPIIIPASVTNIGEKAFGYSGYIGNPVKEEDFTIYGYIGTAAETYAVENGFTFIPLEDNVTDVTYTPTWDSVNDYGFTVSGRADKLQVIEANGGTRTVTRNSPNVVIKSYDINGNEVNSLSRELDYEVWTVNTRLTPDTELQVHAKYNNEWVDATYRFSVSTLYSDKTLKKAELSATSGGQGVVNCNIVTGSGVSKVRVEYEDGMTSTYHSGYATLDVENMTYTYDITIKAYRTGEIPYKIYIKTPSGWQYATTLTYTAE